MLLVYIIITSLLASEFDCHPSYSREERGLKESFGSAWKSVKDKGKAIAEKIFGNKNVKAVAGKVLGKENNQFCPKTKAEAEKALKKEQRTDLHEGDVLMTEKLKKFLEQVNKTAGERDVLTFTSMHWSDKTIPYVFDSSLSDRAKEAAKAAFKDFTDFTCVKFVPRTAQADYIRFFKGEGCYSFVGKNGGAQDLSIGLGCEFKGTIIHECMHAMGFFHEHTRLDRDNYVKINWGNIKTGMDVNFRKYAVGSADYLGQPYDFNSIMHYPETAFAKDGTGKTIEIIASVSPKPTIGQRDGMSEIDIKQIKKLFKCEDTTTPAPATTVVATTKPPAIPITTAPVTKAPVTTAPVTTAPATTAAPPTAAPVTTVKTTKATVPGGAIQTTIVPGTTAAPAPSTTKAVVTQPIPSQTPTTATPSKQPGSTIQPTAGQTTQPIIVNPGKGQKVLIQIKTGTAVGTYPQWPYDFNWNTNGVPQSCNCQTCNCQCVHMNEPQAGVEWKSNYLCYKKRGDIDPGIKWSYNGDIEGMRCTHISDPTFAKYWENNFLCVPKESPYRFVWSFRGPVDSKDMACVKMGVPGGPKEWLDNYLCGIKSKAADDDV